MKKERKMNGRRMDRKEYEAPWIEITEVYQECCMMGMSDLKDAKFTETPMDKPENVVAGDTKGADDFTLF